MPPTQTQREYQRIINLMAATNAAPELIRGQDGRERLTVLPLAEHYQLHTGPGSTQTFGSPGSNLTSDQIKARLNNFVTMYQDHQFRAQQPAAQRREPTEAEMRGLLTAYDNAARAWPPLATELLNTERQQRERSPRSTALPADTKYTVVSHSPADDFQVPAVMRTGKPPQLS